MAARVLNRADIALLCKVLRMTVEDQTGENLWFAECVNHVADDLEHCSTLTKAQLDVVRVQNARTYEAMHFEPNVEMDDTLKLLLDHVFDHLDEFKPREQNR